MNLSLKSEKINIQSVTFQLTNHKAWKLTHEGPRNLESLYVKTFKISWTLSRIRGAETKGRF